MDCSRRVGEAGWALARSMKSSSIPNPCCVVFARIEAAVAARGPTNEVELKQFWKRCFEEIPQSEVCRLVGHCHERLKEVVRQRGKTLLSKWRY